MWTFPDMSVITIVCKELPFLGLIFLHWACFRTLFFCQYIRFHCIFYNILFIWKFDLFSMLLNPKKKEKIISFHILRVLSKECLIKLKMWWEITANSHHVKLNKWKASYSFSQIIWFSLDIALWYIFSFILSMFLWFKNISQTEF